MTAPSGDPFGRVPDVLVPDGGALVAIAEVYVDESGSHKGSPVLSVGGYVFLKSRSRAFVREWNEELRRRGVPYFHMTDCANGNAHYKAWSMGDRIAHETRLIELTRKYSAFGFSVSVSVDGYKQSLGGYEAKLGSVYTFLLRNCLSETMSWAN